MRLELEEHVLHWGHTRNRTEQILSEGVPTTFLENRYYLDPSLSPAARALQRLLLFVQDVQQLFAEDLAELQEPLQACREAGLDQAQYAQLEAVQTIYTQLQEIVAQKIAAMEMRLRDGSELFQMDKRPQEACCVSGGTNA